MAKSEAGQVRHFPGPHGDFISPNYDLGSGPYTQNNGKPYGGMSAKQFIDKKRARKKKKSKALLQYCTLFQKIAMSESIDKYRHMLDKSLSTLVELATSVIDNKGDKVKHSEFAQDRFVLRLDDSGKFFSGVDIQDQSGILMVLTFRPGPELKLNISKDDNKIKLSIRMPELEMLAKMNSSHNLKKLLSDMVRNKYKLDEMFVSNIA